MNRRYLIVLVTIIFLLVNQNVFCQNSSIVGKCIDYKKGDELPGVCIYFYTHSGKEFATNTGMNGNFALKTGDESGDTIIRYFGSEIKILNIPEGHKQIDLGKIRIVENFNLFLFNTDGSLAYVDKETINELNCLRTEILEEYRIKVLEKELKPYFAWNDLIFDYSK
ncbi:MAG: hypothetical protein ACK5M7_06980 [Draconibacterium sp.]